MTYSGRRFTPTGVGTIGARGGAGNPAAVHPHGRGDNYDPTRFVSFPIGSPPRAWGQCRCRHYRRSAARFTPTGVGTMPSRPRRRASAMVHPHGRGDNLRRPLARVERHGSPPRAWGQSILNSGEDRNLRFTPTGVGTIRFPSLASAARSVHPHGRGDNRRARCVMRCVRGSPPRAWGQWRVLRARV